MDGSYTPLSEVDVGSGGHSAPPPPQQQQFHAAGASPLARPQAGATPAQPQRLAAAPMLPNDAELYTMVEAGDAPGWGLPSNMPVSVSGRRDWSGGLFQWVGRGTSRDWQVCCMSLWCLPVVFAQNMRRALLLDYWRQGILCMLCWGLNWSMQLLALGACGNYPELELDDAASITSSNFRQQIYDAEVATYMRCARGWQPILVLMHLLSWCFLLYAGYRRIQMRRRFGLPGDDLRDYLSWLCCAPCSAAQETRTLAANQVAQGVWHGPGAGPAPATQVTAPQGQAMFMPASFPMGGNGGMVFYQGPMPGQLVAMPQGMQHMMMAQQQLQQQQHDGLLWDDDSDLLLRPGAAPPAYGHPAVPPPPPQAGQHHGSLL